MPSTKPLTLNWRAFHGIDIMFCCNDYRNGHFLGKFDQVSVERYEIQLDGPPTALRRVNDRLVKIGRREFKCGGWAEWVGNWCWDQLTIMDGADLLMYLRAKGFVCSEAPANLYERWNATNTPAQK